MAVLFLLTAVGSAGATPAVPVIDSVSPNVFSNAGGTTVVITGSYFTAASRVEINSWNVAAFTVDSDTQITATVATVPWAAAGAHLRVYTSGGVSPDTSTNSVTYTATPTISTVSPNSGALSGGGTVTITGVSFVTATDVKFGTTPASFTVNSNTSITATVPAHAAGSVGVTVTNGDGTSLANKTYTYAAPAPVVSSLSPVSGSTAGGESVVLTGSGFTGASAVKFGAASAMYTVDSDTQITATAPAGAAGATAVKVTAPGGLSAGSVYTYIAPPANTIRPAVSGDATIGGTLTATLGDWSGSAPLVLGYQWQRCDDAGCADVAGANTASYTVPAGDVGFKLRVRVTAGNAIASGVSADSDMTGAVPAAPVVTPPPVDPTPVAPVAPKVAVSIGSGKAGAAKAARAVNPRKALAIGCSSENATLESCKVKVTAVVHGRTVVIGTATATGDDDNAVSVPVKLNAVGRRLLASSAGGVQVRVVVEGHTSAGVEVAQATTRLVAKQTATLLDGFAIDSAELSASGRRYLADLAGDLRRDEPRRIVVTGHTDSSGRASEEYRRALGLARARAVAAYLRDRGVDAAFAAESAADGDPVASNATAAGKARNRRVTLDIYR